MKRSIKYSIHIIFTALLIFAAPGVFAQMKTYDWEPYKTRFEVPSDFIVTESNGMKWSGKNNDIVLSIYPHKGENLSQEGMLDALYKWLIDNGVSNIGDALDLNSEVLNGYWGYLYEGTVDGFPVATMVLVDPDYPDISLYIWVSYREESEDTVIEILMSFVPM